MSNLITSLLKTEKGQIELENGGKPFGIKIIPTSSSSSLYSIIDFQNLNFNSLEMVDLIPLGYEEEEISINKLKRKSIERITVTIERKENSPLSYKLISYSFLPSCDINTFEYYLSHSNSGQNARGIDCLTNESTSFDLEVHIHPNYEGYLNTWMILEFEGIHYYNQISSITSRCYISIRISGNVINESITKNTKELSIEAAPFIPQLAKTYFDSEVS